jgi:hypothetical protein
MNVQKHFFAPAKGLINTPDSGLIRNADRVHDGFVRAGMDDERF